jgi:peptide/nickel transport system substrate-binding protein
MSPREIGVPEDEKREVADAESNSVDASSPSENNPKPQIHTRREALQGLVLGAGFIGVGGLLPKRAGRLISSRASGAFVADRLDATVKKPRRGGTLTAGLTGGGATDSISPYNPQSTVDAARMYQLYNLLVTLDNDANVQLQLASEVSSNADATVWTIRVKQGVTFHNGKELGADDVLYTFQQNVNPKSPQPGAPLLAPLDLGSAKLLDKYTVQIPMLSPYSTFDEALTAQYFFIAPTDYDPSHPVGTGPFMYRSFTPGQQSVFDRNPSYWQEGLPYVDKVVITDYSDETSQVNALLSGQADVINSLSSASVAPVRNGGQHVLITDSGGWIPFTMRVDQAPFNDVRVRQAMRWMVDRPQMLELLYGNHEGNLGKDLYSLWDPDYDHALPQREQDIGRAKSLLKAAGHENLNLTLVTAPIAAGAVNAAQILKQQAMSAGVTINVQQVTATEFYGPKYLNWTFAQDWWSYAPYFIQVAAGSYKTAPYNECHFDNPTYNTLYETALRTTNSEKKREIAYEMQQLEYDSGGYIIPFFFPTLDAYRANVKGVSGAKTGESLGNYDFQSMWLS